MVMKASLKALVDAAAGWDGIGLELHNAYSDIVGYESNGSKFGWYADRAGIPAQHDTFIAAMADALLAGQKVMNDVGTALRDVAKDFGATDLDVKDQFHKLDGTPA
ncbi:hypothetical protein ACOACQ_16570 [Nocardioides sp. CPCC 206347]|uniref:hypothetical protein n=1 Tax=unclassified Nocardioides TaxID=2615069 RepID=UPI00360E8C3A